MERGRRLKNKKASIELSFQFLFSIILIAVVLFVGFYVIKMFLGNAEKVKLLQTVEDVKSKVDEVSASDGSKYVMHFKLNSAVQGICFANASTCRDPLGFPGFCNNISAFKTTGENMFFYPLGSASKYKVKSAFEIYCGGSQKKSCLNVTQAQCFKRNLNNEFQFSIEKPNENSLVFIKS
jgi:hypothetical protein